MMVHLSWTSREWWWNLLFDSRLPDSHSEKTPWSFQIWKVLWLGFPWNAISRTHAHSFLNIRFRVLWNVYYFDEACFLVLFEDWGAEFQTGFAVRAFAYVNVRNLFHAPHKNLWVHIWYGKQNKLKIQGFLLVMFGTLFLMTYIPDLVLFIPRLFGYGAWVKSRIRTPFFYSIGFFIFLSILVSAGLKKVFDSELPLVIGMVGLMVVISFIALFSSSFNIHNLSTEFNVANILIPYGVILFALGGASAIPQIKEDLNHKKRSIKKVVILGSVIPLVFLLIFFYGLGLLQFHKLKKT